MKGLCSLEPPVGTRNKEPPFIFKRNKGWIGLMFECSSSNTPYNTEFCLDFLITLTTKCVDTLSLLMFVCLTVCSISCLIQQEPFKSFVSSEATLSIGDLYQPIYRHTAATVIIEWLQSSTRN